MAATKPRIPIPTNADELLELARQVYEKHLALGTVSPLSALSWVEEGPKIAKAIAFQAEAEEAKRRMEIAYEQRNLLLGGVGDIVRASRDVLSGVHRHEMRKLGEYGYTVDDTPRRAPAKAAVKAAAAQA